MYAGIYIDSFICYDSRIAIRGQGKLMLGLFSAKSDHPLADAKEAKRLFADLAGKDASAALDDATILLESLQRDHLVPLDQRWQIVQQMDATLLAAARRYARDYAAATHASRNEELRQWRLGADYWSQLVAAYLGCLGEMPNASSKAREALKPELPLLYARALHALAATLKWQQFRYGPTAPDFWQVLGKTYLDAVAAKLAQKSAPLYPGAPASSPEREYLKALVFHASSLDSLLPQEIELAERLLDHLLPQFQFGDQERPDSVYWVDAATAQPPTRLAVKPPRTASLRYFSPGMALDAAYALKLQAEQAIPASLNLGNSYPGSMVVDVLDHLASYWSPVPPQRSHVRHRVKSRLTVVPSLAAAYRSLASGGGNDARAESWLVEDVSQGGMRASAQLTKDSRLGINTLLLMQPEGGSNWLLGVVRRFARDSEASAGLGIETLTKQPRALCVDSGGIQTEVILIDPWESSAQVRVALPATAWEDNIAMTFNDGGKAVKLFPDGQVQSGPDYLIGRYRVRVAE